MKDPAKPILMRARRYPDVQEGSSCSQTSFKSGKSAFLYLGMQGGRHKAMFKLDGSMPEALELAENDPDRFQVGSTSWVTARFTPQDPLPRKLWQKWLDESHALSLPKRKR